MATTIEKSELLTRQQADLQARVAYEQGPRREYIQGIRDYSEGQIDVWSQVPYLTLMTHPGMSSGNTVPACALGFWPIESSGYRNGSIAVWVDLESGALIKGCPFNNDHAIRWLQRGLPQDFTPADDADVLKIDIEELDASAIVARARDRLLPNMEQHLGVDKYIIKDWGVAPVFRRENLRPSLQQACPQKTNANPTS